MQFTIFPSNEHCIGTRNGPWTGAPKWGCHTDSDCCNPDATCSSEKLCVLSCGRAESSLTVNGQTARHDAGGNSASGETIIVSLGVAVVFGLTALLIGYFYCKRRAQKQTAAEIEMPMEEDNAEMGKVEVNVDPSE